jgi:hypothetical protein
MFNILAFIVAFHRSGPQLFELNDNLFAKKGAVLPLTEGKNGTMRAIDRTALYAFPREMNVSLRSVNLKPCIF